MFAVKNKRTGVIVGGKVFRTKGAAGSAARYLILDDVNKELVEAEIIEKAYLKDLEEAARELACLESWGVDNWSGYSEAMQDFHKMED